MECEETFTLKSLNVEKSGCLVLDMHGSREAYVPLKPFNPFTH
jgi:hypothetical protein